MHNLTTAEEYIRMIAMSQDHAAKHKEHTGKGWLTVGKTVAQLCLNGGANDFGSIMIEENVVKRCWRTSPFYQHYDTGRPLSEDGL